MCSYQFSGDPNDIFAQFFKGKVQKSSSFGSHQPGGFGGSDMFHDGGDIFGMFGGGMGHHQPQAQRKAITVDLPVSLEQLYSGSDRILY